MNTFSLGLNAYIFTNQLFNKSIVNLLEDGGVDRRSQLPVKYPTTKFCREVKFLKSLSGTIATEMDSWE